MTRYRGPRVKIIRRLGLLPGLTKKVLKIEQKHQDNMVKMSFYENINVHLYLMIIKCLFEKQTLRFNYGVTEKQLISST